MEEKDYVGLSDSCSAFRVGKKDADLAEERESRGEERESEEEELELGLSLGAGGKVTASTGVVVGGAKNKAMNGCRILTAKDFMEARTLHGDSRASPMSSSSSSSVAESDAAAAAGSANPPSPAVGWPPIGFFRFNNLVNQSKDNSSKSITNKKNDLNSCNSKVERISSKNEENIDGTLNSNIKRFVKVNMDGDLIGRKVDLDAHQSYESLALALEIMFHKPTTGLDSSTHGTKVSKLLDGSSGFVLTYKDKDGDWMLVGDVPWEMFLDTVKRLKIMRTCDSNGLAPRFQSSPRGLLRSKPI